MSDFLLILLVPVLASLACLVWLTARRSLASLRATLTCSSLSLLVWAWACWQFRDGIGLGQKHSQGLAAVQNFVELAWVPLLGCLVFSVVSVAVYRRRKVRYGAA